MQLHFLLMAIQKLNLLNFKNLTQVEVEFSEGINCIVGNNGSGKTNLIDAIYYLSFCKSFVNPIDSQNINFNSDHFMLHGNYQIDDRGEEIACTLKKGQKKLFKRNKKDYERLSDHIGHFPLVVISPSDEELINGASEERRRYMDSVISQFDRHYLNTIIRYARLILQRNTLIKGCNGNINSTILDVYDDQLVDLCRIIFETRQRFISDLLPIFQKYYSILSSESEVVGIEYKSQYNVPDFRAAVLNARERDIMLGHTTKGIHRDELDFTLATYPIRKYGSQGQKKSYLIALKLAHLDYLTAKIGRVPMLLLDDIFDKLDKTRGKQLIQLVSQSNFAQIFITDTQYERLTSIVKSTGKPYKVFSVDKGIVNSELV